MCCPKHKMLLFGLFISFFLTAECEIEVQVLTKTTPCESTCNGAFPTSTANASRCRRGCRLLLLARLTSPDADGGASCRASCAEAHADAAQRAACNVGCQTPYQFPALAQAELEGVPAQLEVSWAVYVQGGADVLPIQPDLEPDDVLTDPGLRKQLELGADELPQTHVRSMNSRQPVQRTEGQLAWCGLPPYVNMLLVIIGYLLAMYLCIADIQPQHLCNDLEKEADSLEKAQLLDLPPKYSEVQMA